MRPSGHLHNTSIALAFLFTLFHNFSILEGVLFLSGSLLLDGDFFISKKLFKIANHREFLTHSVLFYIILIILCLITHFVLFWLFLGALYHLFFDLLDWGLPLIPFRHNTYFTPHLLEVPTKLDEVYFFKTYFNNKIIFISELLFLLGFIVSLAFLPVDFIILLLLIEILVISEFTFQFRKARSLA